MTALVLVIGLLVVLAVAAAVSDRAAAQAAERRASAYAVAPLGADARVRVHGTPFLTQAARGRYADIEVTAPNIAFGVFTGVRLHAHLQNTLVPARALLGRRVSELPVEHVRGEVLLPYDQLARVSRVPGLRLSVTGGRLRAAAALPIPGFGQLAQVSGEALADIDATGTVWLRVRDVAVAGISLPGLLLNQLVPSLTFPIPLPPLPYGLRIEQLTPTPEGLQVAGTARAVVLRALAPATASSAGPTG